MNFVRVAEVFESIQGESTFAGLPCLFIRLSECNLRCSYCDTKSAYGKGRKTSVADLVRRSRASAAAIVEITGGEPLLQEAFGALACDLRDRSGKRVLVETNGSMDISTIPSGVAAIVDVKGPGSGECGSFDPGNLARLRKYDEVKFVICDRKDYLWARRFTREHELPERCGAVLFSPASRKMSAGQLGRWIVQDGVPVRLQVQLQKMAGMK
ncbi:MAG: 7-carboxy-7-deazaguanine synthase QueE [Verrucomicrobia bacterium]|nr:7-carboxy-7-deazaguanine synthase QueE [Verrucomicrobiota bacterium]